MTKNLVRCSLFLSLLFSTAHGQLVVDFDLGELGIGSYSIIGDTTGAGDEASNYPPATNPAVTWLEDVVYQFTTTAEYDYQLFNNSISGDADFFLLDSLSTTFDGTHNLADGTIQADFMDAGADGDSAIISPGTYYLVADAYGGALPGDSSLNVGPYDISMNLSEAPMSSSLGNVALDDGFYDRAFEGTPDHPYGTLDFEVDTTGNYDILADWMDSTGSSFDGYLYLFDAPFMEDDFFNIANDDDFNGTAQSLITDVALTAGQTYYLVATTWAGMPDASGLMGDITVFGPGSATRVGGISGDFDGDGDYACADIDALVATIAAGTNDTSFDLNGDGVVDAGDLSDWLAEAGAAENASGGAYLPGDANLDGVVDVSDFNVWNSDKFATTEAWCRGDFNADGFSDVSDFNIWNANKFQSSDGASVVPEPSSAALASLMLMMLAWRRSAGIPSSV